jgi:predicted HTH transcriptional regulator
LDNLEELQSLHANRVQESASLEYKASAAVNNAEAKKSEIAKDISAMANAEGGQFVYGMSEANHMPNGLDEGFSPNPFNGLWFEQVIQQNIRPSVEGLKILQIP